MQTLVAVPPELDLAICRLKLDKTDFALQSGRQARQLQHRHGTRPSAKSIHDVSRMIHVLTSCRWLLLDERDRVERLNRTLLGWANYFRLGPVSRAYVALDRHASRRLRR